ncbi:MAG: phosphorylase, partial [Phormidesmis sp.]
KLYMSRYLMLLNAVGIDTTDMDGVQTAPYNLLCTRQWMMLIPRSQEKYADISVNSLGFAGSLLVKNEEELAKLQEIGPMTLLEQVGDAQQDE